MSHRDLHQIGKYQIEDLIGEGAMGVVYRAFDPVLNRRVAIKVMGDALARDTDLRDRFLREARAAGSLQHPNVITIYDFGEVDGHLYIAMEYIDGTDLEDLLRSGAPISLDSKLAVMIDVLNGLGYAHKRGVVHRDIKPANIRVDEDGHARIMDFGIARLNSGAMTKMTRTGIMLGTPNYMAPEQIVGEEITPRTDIFAAGAVLYELLTNARPFQAETLHAVLFKITSEPPPPLDQLLPGLPAALNDIVMKALEKEPENRFPTAMEMASALARVRATLSSSHASSPSLHATIEQARLSGKTLRPPTTATRRILLGGGGVLGVAAVVALTLVALDFQHRGSGPGEGEGEGEGATRQSAAPKGSQQADSSAAATGRQADGAGASVRIAEPRGSGGGAVAANDGEGARSSVALPPVGTRAAAATPPPDTRGPSAAELQIVREARDRARNARLRATSVGATASMLLTGDEHQRRAEDALRAGDVTQAAAQFSQAATAWTAAERDARSEAASSSLLAGATRESVRTPTRPLASGSQSAATSASAPPPVIAPAPTPEPVTNPAVAAAAATADINAVIASYASAIEARDVGAMRRLYPAMTRDQQRSFERFFASVRSMKAQLIVASLQLDGPTAEARITGSYAYVTTTGRAERQDAGFHATLRFENGAWRMTAVR